MGNKIQEKVLEAIENYPDITPEKAEQAKLLFKKLLSSPPKKEEVPLGLDYFKLSFALCAAALCVGKTPATLNATEVRSAALIMAKNLFTEDGELAPSKYANGKK